MGLISLCLFAKIFRSRSRIRGSQVSGVWFRVSGLRNNSVTTQCYVYVKDLKVEKNYYALAKSVFVVFSLLTPET